MPAAQSRKEVEYWSRQLDATSSEERKTLADSLRWIDADQPPQAAKRPADPIKDRGTLWDV